MMWYDNSSLSLPEKVGKAAIYYQGKYGKLPTLVMVNPKDYQDCNCNGIAIEPSNYIMPNHFLIGLED